MEDKIVKIFLEDYLKAEPQQDPIWFESLEHEGQFTMDLQDVLNKYTDYIESINNDEVKELIKNAMEYHRLNMVQKVGTILQEEIVESDYKNDFITDILRKIRY